MDEILKELIDSIDAWGEATGITIEIDKATPETKRYCRAYDRAKEYLKPDGILNGKPDSIESIISEELRKASQ